MNRPQPKVYLVVLDRQDIDIILDRIHDYTIERKIREAIEKAERKPKKIPF